MQRTEEGDGEGAEAAVGSESVGSRDRPFRFRFRFFSFFFLSFAFFLRFLAGVGDPSEEEEEGISSYRLPPYGTAWLALGPTGAKAWKETRQNTRRQL